MVKRGQEDKRRGGVVLRKKERGKRKKCFVTFLLKNFKNNFQRITIVATRLEKVTMQVNRINNNTNNVNFKAKPVVKLGDKFFDAFRALAPLDCATQASEAANVIRFFKRVAPGIAKEDDVLILRSDEIYPSTLEIALARNDYEDVNEQVSFLSKDSSPMRDMQVALRSLSIKYRKNKSIDFEQTLMNPYTNYLYSQGTGNLIRRMPILDRPAISTEPQAITIEDCINELRALNTQG